MQWVGWLVIGFVCFWMVIIALVVLRTGLFMLMLTWAGLKQWQEHRADPALAGPQDSRQAESRPPLPKGEGTGERSGPVQESEPVP